MNGRPHWNEEIPGAFHTTYTHHIREIGSYISSHVEDRAGVYMLVAMMGMDDNFSKEAVDAFDEASSPTTSDREGSAP